jgi:plasmid stabilization system protein ParE
MKLLFDDLALADFEGIFHWIAKDNPVQPKPWSSASLRAPGIRK